MIDSQVALPESSAFSTPGAPATDARLRLSVFGPDAPVDGFAALADEWNPLVQRTRFDNFFSTYEWQTTWWEYLGQGDLWILAFRRADTGALVGIAPLYIVLRTEGPTAGKREVHFVGCIEVSDYLDLIVEPGWEAAVAADLLAWLASDAAPAWDILDLCNLPEESLTHHLLPTLTAAYGWPTQVFQEDTAPQFKLPLHFDDYLQEQVDKKQRHEIRRKQRRVEREAQVQFMMVDRTHALEAEVDDFVALQRASRADKADFMTPAMRRFFLGVARRMLDVDRLRLFFLTIDGEKAATLYAFEYGRRFWLYNSGYDPAAHAQFSPGWVLLAYAIQYAIAAGCREFDFMQGDEEYKYRFGAQDYKVMRAIVTRPD
jgi:CelD/BcsL family acetyltransferase involved in cellulose biosynthesis